MKNVIFLVIDSLSREYIDSYSLKQETIFHYLDSKYICAANMYSVAPFTESALQGLWNQNSPMETFWGNRLEAGHDKSIFQVFQEAGYEIYFTNSTSVQNLALDYEETDKKKKRKILNYQIDKLLPQIKYYVKKEGSCIDIEKAIINMLDILYNAMQGIEKDLPLLAKEMQNYQRNKRLYCKSLIKQRDTHQLFLCHKISEDKKEDKKDFPLVMEELLLAQSISYKNRKLFKEYNKNSDEKLVKRHLSGEVFNRDIQSNSNILELMRMDLSEREDIDIHRGIIASGIHQFIEKEIKDIKKPYFAYFHEFSFHYPEVFLNACKNENKYKAEIKKLLEKIPDLETGKMSVSRTLSLLYVNEWLEELIKYLEEKKIFEDTYLVITADHGISNFMYPIDREYRWMFYKENFHVPFWIVGKNLESKNYDTLCSSKCIVPTLAELCGIKGADYSKSLFHLNQEYIITEWMNGIPDIEKEYVKFGFRNQKISLTYCIRLNQLFGSGRILTLFDLQSDPNEYRNLSNDSKDVNKEINLELQSALPIIHHRWDTLRKKYLDYKYREVFDCTKIDIEWLQGHHLNNVFSNMILYGTDEIATKFLSNYKQAECQEILDATARESYFMGRKVKKDIENIDIEKSTFIIACNNEIDALYQLWRWGVKRVYVYTGK